jgi:hypothetical protein
MGLSRGVARGIIESHFWDRKFLLIAVRLPVALVGRA